MAKTKQNVLLPGEFISTEEEFASGKNTYSENGSIKSSIIGVADFNDSTKEVAVKGKSTQTIKEGDIVYGKVVLVKESTVVLELVSADGGKKITQKSAQIPVRNVSTQYVDNLKKLFKIGDIVKARAVMVCPLAIDIATNEKGLGIVKAYCSKCRSEMNYSSGKLMCLTCGNLEERRWFEDEQLPRQGFGGGGRGGFGERRSFGGPRGHGGGGRSFGGSRGGPGGGRRSFGGRSAERGNFGSGDSERGEFGHGRGDRRNFSGRREGDRGNFGSSRRHN